MTTTRAFVKQIAGITTAEQRDQHPQRIERPVAAVS